MEELYKKYIDVLRENNDLKLRITFLEHKLAAGIERSAEKENEENKFLLEKVEQLERERIEKAPESQNENEDPQKLNDHYKAILKDFRYSITGFLGYKIDKKDDQIHFSSLYSFDRNDKFIFQANGKSYEMVNNHFAEGYKKEIDTFVVKGKSVPALMAHVTLDLFSKRTFQ